MHQILAYWNEKKTLEKIFWVVFMLFAIFSLFYLFAFHELLGRYEALREQDSFIAPSHSLTIQPKPPVKILQEILQFEHNLHISLESKGDIHTLRTKGDFFLLSKLLKFIESLHQTEILDYHFEQKEDMDFMIRFRITKHIFMHSPINKEASLTFFSPRVMDLEMIINHKARISNRWYEIGDKLFGMKIKDITPISVVLENAEHQEMSIGL